MSDDLYTEPLVMRLAPGVTITVTGPMDAESLAVTVCSFLLDDLAEPKRVLSYLAARLGFYP